MDAYKTPDARLNAPGDAPLQPIKAVLLGLSVSILLLAIASTVLAVIFAVAVGIDFDELDSFEQLLVTNIPFMLVDLLLSASVCYFAGVVIGRHTPGKEYRYAIIVCIITLSLFLLLEFSGDSNYSFPLWFDFLSYLLIPVTILFGARPARSLSK